MTGKSITGIIIISLNLAGICFMMLMFILSLNQKIKDKRMAVRKAKRPKRPGRGQKEATAASFNKADYLLDDMDLSDFDDLDLDGNE